MLRRALRYTAAGHTIAAPLSPLSPLTTLPSSTLHTQANTNAYVIGMVLGALIVILVLLVIYSIYSQCSHTPKAEQAASSNNKQDEETTTSSIELVESASSSNGGLHLKSTSSTTAAAIERARSASGRSLPPPIPPPLNLWDEPLGAPTYAPHGIDVDEEAWCKENASDWRVVEEPKEAARDWRVVEEPPPTSPQREEDLYDFGDDDARLPASRHEDSVEEDDENPRANAVKWLVKTFEDAEDEMLRM